MFRFTGFLVAGLVLVGAIGRFSPAEAEATGAAVQRPFLMFDATLYKNKPSFTGYPLRPITLLYESRLLPNDRSRTAVPLEPTIRAIANDLSKTSGPVIVDIERWPVRGEMSTVQATIDKFVSVLSWMRSEAPNVSIGVYSTIPIRDYWRAIRGPSHKDYHAWQRENDRLDGIVAQVDALFPSIYTFYPDRQGWVTYAVAQLREARRKANGKPVYAFLWPQYHESNRELGHRHLDADYWEIQLNTVAQHADGVVIWGGVGKHGPEPWNEAAPWWQVTKRFMRHINSDSPDRPNSLPIH
ncbi:MAG: hypothetical protein KF722_05135 [Nitrospira sp.]|nr:hypothetical protein [Nitrospira sp.]